MATISLADIELVSNTTPELYIANEAIVAGELFYLDSDTKANKAANTAAATDEIAGIALQDAAAGNRVVGIPNGATIQVSNALTVGDVYILAATAGDVMLASDLLSTQFLSQFATVNNATPDTLVLEFNNTGSVKA